MAILILGVKIQSAPGRIGTNPAGGSVGRKVKRFRLASEPAMAPPDIGEADAADRARRAASERVSSRASASPRDDLRPRTASVYLRGVYSADLHKRVFIRLFMSAKRLGSSVSHIVMFILPQSQGLYLGFKFTDVLYCNFTSLGYSAGRGLVGVHVRRAP